MIPICLLNNDHGHLEQKIHLLLKHVQNIYNQAIYNQDIYNQIKHVKEIYLKSIRVPLSWIHITN